MSSKRKFSRNLDFSYRPRCHHCVNKLSALLNKFHIDHQVVSGTISDSCACRIEGRAKDKLVIKLVRRIFNQHKEGKLGFMKDAECKSFRKIANDAIHGDDKNG